MRTKLRLSLILPGIILLAGCGKGGTENLSTKADEDPALHAEARAEAERIDQEAREAEARALGTLNIEDR